MNKNNDINKYSGLDELINAEVMKNYNEFIVDQALKYIKEPKQVIDFGAGIGTLSLVFKEKYGINPLCIEIDNINKDYLSERGFVHFDSFEDISMKSDLIFSSNALEHIEDDLSILNLMRSNLTEGGLIYLYLPAKMFLWTELDEIVGHYRRYDMNAIKEKCKKSGLKVVKTHYADSLGFFASLLIKIVGYNPDKGIGSVTSLRFYDKWLLPISKLMDFIGFKYFFGKNLIVVAKKN